VDPDEHDRIPAARTILDQSVRRRDRRFDGLREELHSHFRETHGHFDEIYRRLERLEQEYQAIVQALRRIKALMIEEGGRRELLERRLESLRQQLVALQLRIDDLEQRLRP
jgi:chromosome segregation ATPase